MSAMYAVDATHFSLVQSLKNTIRKLKREKQSGLDELRRTHYLQGTFAKLCEREHFQELVFPGFSREARRGLPSTLVELFEWEELQLDLDSIAANAATVLKNIKTKGAKQGQMMDLETEKVLMPQIAQEALAKRVLEEVQKLNRKISSMIANSVKPIAAPTDERAERDILDEDVCTNLRNHGFAGQREFLGVDWIPVVQKDLLRYVRDEKLSAIDGNGLPMGDVRVEDVPYQRIAWLEHDEDLKETYPALYEVVDSLHGLAYELNAKGLLSDLTLLEPGKGCTLLTIHPVGSEQRMRLDTRQNVEGFDSGIRVTACYNIHLRIEVMPTSLSSREATTCDGKDSRGDDARVIRGYSEIQFLPQQSSSEENDSHDQLGSQSKAGKKGKLNNREAEAIGIPVVDDLLTVHRSASIQNKRTPEYWTAEEAMAATSNRLVEDEHTHGHKTPGIVWATIHHFICGRDASSTSIPLAQISRQLSSNTEKSPT